MAGGGEVIKGRTRYIVEYFNQGGRVIEGDSAILINEDGNEDLQDLVDEDEDFIHMNINQVGTDVFFVILLTFRKSLAPSVTFTKREGSSRIYPGNK